MDLIYVFVPPGILVITQLLLKMKGQTEAKQDIKMSSMEQLEEEKEVAEESLLILNLLNLLDDKQLISLKELNIFHLRLS